MSISRGFEGADEEPDDSRVPAGVGGGTGDSSAEGAAARKPAAKSSGSSGRSPFGAVGRRWRETVGELRKVVWPTRNQLITYTIVVIVFVTIMCAYAAGLDFAFTRFMFWAFA